MARALAAHAIPNRQGGSLGCKSYRMPNDLCDLVGLRLHFIVATTFPASDDLAVHFVFVSDHKQGAALAAKILVGVRSHSDRGGAEVT